MVGSIQKGLSPLHNLNLKQTALRLTFPRDTKTSSNRRFDVRSTADFAMFWGMERLLSGVDTRHMAESGKKSLLFFLASKNHFSPVFSSEIENLGSFIPEKSGIRVSFPSAFLEIGTMVS